MSIKSVIQTLINTKLASASAITAVEHREVADSVLDNFYPDVSELDQSDTSIITLNPALSGVLTYNVNIHKQGRTVTIDCILSKSTTSLFNGWIFEITNSEYFGKSVSPLVIPSYEFVSIANFLDYTVQGILKADNKFYTVIDGGTKQFTLTYQTLN